MNTNNSLTVDIISAAIAKLKDLRPAIRPSECKCGKHKVYWMWSHPEQRDAALAILSEDKGHTDFIDHIMECGIRGDYDVL